MCVCVRVDLQTSAEMQGLCVTVQKVWQLCKSAKSIPEPCCTYTMNNYII